jgi:hypothetical protein
MTQQNAEQRLAEERMNIAKRRFSAAARAALKGDPSAPELAKAAYAEVNGAREELRALEDQHEPSSHVGRVTCP